MALLECVAKSNCGSCSRDAVALHLAFADHVHSLNARQDGAGTPEILESHHGPGPAFDHSMILPDDVVRILELPDLDGHLPLSVDGPQRGQISPAFLHGHGLRRTVLIDGLLEVEVRGSLVAMRTQQEIDRIAGLVRCPIRVLPYERLGATEPLRQAAGARPIRDPGLL
jgi:hypothetical protein